MCHCVVGELPLWVNLSLNAEQYLERPRHLKVWLCEASRHSDHGGGQWAGDADGGQELGDVWSQAERNGAVGIQVACCVVDIKAEVGDVQFSCVLEAEDGNKKSEATAVI